MADNLKIVKVSYNGKPITKNDFLGKILKTDDDVIPMASSLFQNEGKDSVAVINVDDEDRIVDINVLTGYRFEKDQQALLANAIVSKATGTICFANNTFNMTSATNFLSLMDCAGIEALDSILQDKEEFFSSHFDFNWKLTKEIEKIKYDKNYLIDFGEVKSKSQYDVNTVNYSDNFNKENLNWIIEKLSKSQNKRYMAISLDDQMNYINAVSFDTIDKPKELLVEPLLSEAENIIVLENSFLKTPYPNPKTIENIYKLETVSKAVGINMIDYGVVNALDKNVFYLKESGVLSGDMKSDLEKLSKLNNEPKLVNIKINRSYVIEGEENNGTKRNVVTIPYGTVVDGVDISSFDLEPRTINYEDDNKNICSIPYREDEKIKLKRGEEIIYVTAGALASTDLIKDYSHIIDSETEYIDYEDLSWDEYIKQFVSDNIDVLEGESISKEYFADEFINCVEIPESDTMNFLDHFEPVVFDYLNGDNEKVDNFDFLKLNIIKNGVKDFAESNLAAENGFIKVSKELVSDLKGKYLSNSKQKSNDIEMEL